MAENISSNNEVKYNTDNRYKLTSKYGEKEIRMNSYNSVNKIISNTLKNRSQTQLFSEYLPSKLWFLDQYHWHHLGTVRSADTQDYSRPTEPELQTWDSAISA